MRASAIPKGSTARRGTGKLSELHWHRLGLRAAAGPDIHIRTADMTVEREVDIIVDALGKRGVFD